MLCRIECTGADQHHVESDGVPSSALHVSLQMDTLDAASMKHLMTFETSLAFEHLSTLARKRRGLSECCVAKCCLSLSLLDSFFPQSRHFTCFLSILKVENDKRHVNFIWVQLGYAF